MMVIVHEREREEEKRNFLFFNVFVFILIKSQFYPNKKSIFTKLYLKWNFGN